MIDPSAGMEISGFSSAISAESEPRRRILAAAYGVFSQKGLQGARTREIARLAQVNIAMIHYYFGNKEDLYERVVEPVFEDIAGWLVNAAASDDDPRRCLEAVMDAYFDFLEMHPEFPRLVMWELAAGGGTLQKVSDAILSREEVSVAARIIHIFRTGRDEGMFKQHQPEQAVISMIALCLFPFAAGDVIDIAFPDLAVNSEFLDERRRHVKDLLIAGLSARK